MKNIKNFETYINDRLYINNDLVLMYLTDKITEKKFNELFLNELNEGLLDNVKNLYKKIENSVLDVLAKIVVNTKLITSKTLNKIYNIISKINNFIKKFKEKNPILYKIILIFIITAVIFIMSILSASAGEPNVVDVHNQFKNNHELVHLCLGMVGELKDSFGMGIEARHGLSIDDFDFLLEAKEFFIAVLDGKETVEISEMGKKVVDSIASDVINLKTSFQDIIQDSSDSYTVERAIQRLINLVDRANQIKRL